MEQQQELEPDQLLEIAEDEISTEAEKQSAPVTAKHAVQLGKIGPERGEQNFQNN
jgi:hypothetical protein